MVRITFAVTTMIAAAAAAHVLSTAAVLASSQVRSIGLSPPQDRDIGSRLAQGPVNPYERGGARNRDDADGQEGGRNRADPDNRAPPRWDAPPAYDLGN